MLERENEQLRAAEEYLIRLSERLAAEGLGGHHPAVTWSLHVSEDISTSLIHAGEQADQEGHEALFLSLSTRGRAALERRAADGSIAMGILEHTTLPLLIVRTKVDQDGARPSA